jgi:LPS-assembly protein
MKKKKTAGISFLILIILLCSIYLISFAYEFHMSADNIEYDEINHILKCNNNVNIYFKEIKIYAKHVSLFINNQSLSASGMVKIDVLANIMYADNVQYNYENNSVIIINGIIKLSDFFIRAEYIKKNKQDIYSLYNVKLSNCDFDHPHTYCKSKEGYLILNKRLVLYSTTLYIGKMPFMYLPIIIQSLDKDSSFLSNVKTCWKPKIRWHFKTLNNKKKQKPKKNKFKSTITLPISKNFTTLLQYNLLGSIGTDYGISLRYCQSKYKNIIFDIAIINYKKNFIAGQIGKIKHLILLPCIIWELNNTWILRSQLKSFNNIPIVKNFKKSYNKNRKIKKILKRNNNNNITTNKIIDILDTVNSFLAISKQFNKMNVDIISEYIMIQKKYIKMFNFHHIILPKINIYSFYNNGLYNIYHKFDFSTKNFFYTESINDNMITKLYLANITDLNYFIKKNLLINKRTTLTTALQITSRLYLLQYSSKYRNREITNNVHFNLNSLYKYSYDTTFVNNKNNFETEYNGLLNCRIRLYDWWYCNIDYNYNYINIYENYLKTHNITISNNIFILDSIQLRNLLLYIYNSNNIYINLCKKNFMSNNRNIKTITPCYTELMFTLHNNIDLYLSLTQNIYPWQYHACNMYFTLNDISDNFCFILGTFYQNHNNDFIYKKQLLSHILGCELHLIPKLIFNYNLKISNMFEYKKNEQTFKLFRKLHCYNLGIIWKKKNKCNVFQLHLSMNIHTSKNSILNLNKNKMNNQINKILHCLRSKSLLND